MTELYVIGHVNPDTDSIASAIGYAWLLRERDGEDTVAARAGAINPQTTWVLKATGVDAPVLMTDASPRFESVSRRFATITPDQPLSEAWTIANRTGGIAPVVNDDGRPYGLVTGWSLFAFMSKLLGPIVRNSTENLTPLMETPAREACSTNVPIFFANSRIRDSLNRILRMEDSDFFVVDDDGRYVGVARQRDLLDPPRLRVVLVDHNEPRQAIGSLDEAELVEVLDHHRLDNASTHTPIRFTVDIVGSTSTLVTERIEEAGLSAPPPIAGVLLGGLLSDTLILSSPTTTDRDRRVAERLARWAFAPGSPLAGETVQSYGQKVIEAGAGLESRNPDEIVNQDMKRYEAGGFKFSIAQSEVNKFIDSEGTKQALFAALERQKDRSGLDFSILMVTNVVASSSRLLIASNTPVLNDLPYPLLQDGIREAKGVVSRKKQLLPVILGLVED
ncbi:DHH family phosphoesterase [bacterium]|nr:DHH family phosphoesterase [bacterium]MCB2179411.1 DHH family phosphoesterase [bacterium]